MLLFEFYIHNFFAFPGCGEEGEVWFFPFCSIGSTFFVKILIIIIISLQIEELLGGKR